MVSFRIITVIWATLLFNSGLARPRSPQSQRFPQFSDNSVGEFILWSCTATAQLQNNNVNKNIVHIQPAAAVDQPATRFHVSSDSPSREDDGQINNINIIRINPLPYRNRGRPVAEPKKPSLETTEINDQEKKHKDATIPIVDSPLKTIKVNAFRKDMPVLFRRKPQLPEIEHRLVNGDEIPLHSSEITVIKMHYL